GSRVGLGVPLAPDLLGGEDLRQEAALLRLGPPLHQRRADEQDAEEVRPRRQSAAGELLGEHDLLHERRAATAILAVPVEAAPAARVELTVPAELPFEALVRGHPELEAVGIEVRGYVRVEPRAELVPEGLFRGAQPEIHEASGL